MIPVPRVVRTSLNWTILMGAETLCWPQTITHLGLPVYRTIQILPSQRRTAPNTNFESQNCSIKTDKNGQIPHGSGHGVAAVDTKVSTGDVAGRVRQQERQGAHEVLGPAHLALGDERNPLLPEVWVVVEYLLGAARCGPGVSAKVLGDTAASAVRETRGNLQGRQHVPRRDAVDADVCVRPLDGQRRGQVADGCFGRVVGPVDGDCQQLFLDIPPLQNPKRAFPSPAKDFGSLGDDEPMRDTTPDQPRASRGPKCFLSPTVPAANCCWSGRWGQRATANLVSP